MQPATPYNGIPQFRKPNDNIIGERRISRLEAASNPRVARSVAFFSNKPIIELASARTPPNNNKPQASCINHPLPTEGTKGVKPKVNQILQGVNNN